jgi:hypothetical protein
VGIPPGQDFRQWVRVRETLINRQFRHPGEALFKSGAGHAGVHFDLDFNGEKSNWIPAFAGMTSKIRVS